MSFTRFSIVADDPFHIKEKLRRDYPGAKEFELDFSRGEPYNPPDVTADQLFCDFFALSLELSRRIGDKNLTKATGTELDDTKNAFFAQLSSSRIERIDEAIRLIMAAMDVPGDESTRIGIEKAVLSGIRGEDYGHPAGEVPVRAVIASQLLKTIALPKDEMIGNDQVILTLGGSEAIGAFFEVLLYTGSLKPGLNAVAMVSPLYTPYKFILERSGVEVIGLPSCTETAYEPSAECLVHFSKLTAQKSIRALVVVNPSNPGSSAMSPPILRQLAEICRKRSIVVVEDIVYSQFLLKKLECLATYYPEGTIIVSSGSKFFQEPGTRFGFVAMAKSAETNLSRIIGKRILAQHYAEKNASIVTALVRAKGPDPYGTFYHTHHVPTPIQWMGIFRMLYGGEDARLFVAELQNRWNALYRGFALQTPAERFPGRDFVPYYALIDFVEVCRANGWDRLADRMERGKLTPEKFMRGLYSEAHVLVLPGATFFPEAPAANVWKMRFSVANQTEQTVLQACTQIRSMLAIWDAKR